jgi:hypothetical protein
MEFEVNTLMGATNEALWNKTDLFTLVDALRVSNGHNSLKLVKSAVISPRTSPVVIMFMNCKSCFVGW